MRYSLLLVYLVSLLGLQYCAQIGNLSGGEKDVSPPKVDTNNLIPQIGATNFSTNEIIIPFDEYFTLENPQKNILIVPSIKTRPIFQKKGKKLIVKFKEELNPNTTYIIQFTNCIKDLNEGTPLQDFKYVFSTGSEIDSLQLIGNVKDAFTQKDLLGYTVGLFNVDTFDQRPYYLSFSDSMGQFRFDYLHEGEYKVIAFKDENGNNALDENENRGFVSEKVNLKSNVLIEEPILCYEPLPKKLFIKEKKYETPGKISIVLNKKTDSLKYEMLSIHKVISSTTENYSDSLNIWVDTTWKSIELKIRIYNNSLDDTLKFLSIKKKKSPIVFKISSGVIEGEELIISSSAPIKSYHDSLIQIYKDSNLIDFTSALDSGKHNILIKTVSKTSGLLQIKILPKAINDFYDSPQNDTIKLKFTTRIKENFGIVNLKFDSTDYNHKIIMLTDNNGNIKYKIKAENTSIYFGDVSPGKYQVIAINDKNLNNRWDIGNLDNNIQPEKVYIVSKSIDVRANWETEIVW